MRAFPEDVGPDFHCDNAPPRSVASDRPHARHRSASVDRYERRAQSFNGTGDPQLLPHHRDHSPISACRSDTGHLPAGYSHSQCSVSGNDAPTSPPAPLSRKVRSCSSEDVQHAAAWRGEVNGGCPARPGSSNSGAGGRAPRPCPPVTTRRLRNMRHRTRHAIVSIVDGEVCLEFLKPSRSTGGEERISEVFRISSDGQRVSYSETFVFAFVPWFQF